LAPASGTNAKCQNVRVCVAKGGIADVRQTTPKDRCCLRP
jgi:hypothetical protein